MSTETAKQIIQVLLYEGGSMKKSEIAKFLNIKEGKVDENIGEIQNLLAVLDMKLIKNATSLEITLSEDINTLISKNKVEELKTELSESALQVLAVIMYKNMATKPEIDFVRGVDSSRSIKNLLMRGIIETTTEKNRKYYMATTETLRYMNLETVENIKEYEEISGKLKTLIEGE